MKGFKDKDGKFHPINNNKVLKHKSGSTEGIKMKQRFKKVKIWKFEDAPEDLKEKILEENRAINVEFDDFWADFDGLIYDKETKIADHEVFSHYGKKYYDLDRGQYLQFPDLEIKDEKKFAKMLGIPKSIADRIDFNFINEGERNTELRVKDLGTYEDITDETEYEDYKKYAGIQSFDVEKKLTKTEFEKIKNAIEKWSDLMHQAWVTLKENYEYQYTDEAVKDTIIANDYDFDEDGKIA